MFSIQRGCHVALRSRTGCVLGDGARRAFSRSCAWQRGALPVFLEPSSPDLTTSLSKLNSKVLLPQHLTKDQQKLVYSQETRAKLEAEPVEITLGDVTLPLEHLDRNRLPDRYNLFRDIVKKSETKEDWENVIRMLEGFTNAGIDVKISWQELVIRKLNDVGCAHLILKALQRPEATGIRMREYSVVVKVLRAVHDKAMTAGWKQDETVKAFKMAKQVVELMESEEHCGGVERGNMLSKTDHRGKPPVVALPTELAAVVALKHGGDKEEVKKLANRLVNALKQDDYMTYLTTFATYLSERPSRNPKDKNQPLLGWRSYFRDFCYPMFELTLVWNALKSSRLALGAEMPAAEEARAFETRAEEVMNMGLKCLEGIKAEGGKSGLVDYVVENAEKCRDL